MKNKVMTFSLITILALSSVSAFASNDLDVALQSNLSYEQKVVQLVNVEREKNGLPALYLVNSISNVARAKSQDMADNNYFSHQSPTYGSAGDMLLRYGITWSAWGENIASGQSTPEKVVSAWMNSPSHRENILSRNFVFIGVGYATNSTGKAYWTQMFTRDEK
ncbi:putative YkwD family protein [Sedimentibacter acidaminivorans]|uniref:YkwD family protein n=1 Tax=Sedimentibacter acidaminivorans TaxID=913099 RepID=A0ABS4GC67_9FIRM|nr:putative YkwD family protein [Sedimentibacter acidaminivorans]